MHTATAWLHLLTLKAASVGWPIDHRNSYPGGRFRVMPRFLEVNSSISTLYPEYSSTESLAT
eukprot:3150590-Rhodomonas_salina.1